MGSLVIRVLVVDDNRTFRAVVCAWVVARSGLELAGEATNGREAITAAGRIEPDLILMDAVMPEMDGFEATRRIKTRSPTPRIAILTLHDSTAMRTAGERAGADGFVPKSELNQELPRLLERWVDESGERAEP